MGLCLPRRRRASSDARRPSVLLLASTMYQSRFTVSALALIVFMGNPVPDAAVERKTSKHIGSQLMTQVQAALQGREYRRAAPPKSRRLTRRAPAPTLAAQPVLQSYPWFLFSVP